MRQGNEKPRPEADARTGRHLRGAIPRPPERPSVAMAGCQNIARRVLPRRIFALRFGSNARRPALVSAVVATLAGAAAPALAVDLEPLPDGIARAQIDGLTLFHDPTAWRIEGEAGTYFVHCRGAGCDDPLMSIVAVPEALTACTPGAVVDRSALDYPDAWNRQVTRAGAVGLDVAVVTLDQGCRNWAGSPVYACTLHDGLAYWFIAPGAQCRTSVADSAALQRLLNGLAPAALTAP